jgi:hypothetical protein
MAVIQISKIQQRRGQKLLSGMPQLSSAEIAWAVDTQELFIGNGSVTEGAPYVGNTKILTEHDNILELAGTYKFAQSDVSITGSIDRSFQGKLDEIQVSVLDFGPMPDPSTDHSEYFMLAFEQLFQNADTTFRKELIVPNGYYYFASVLKIPSYVILTGETKDGVVLDVNSYGIEFLSENGTTNIGFSSTDRPEQIKIKNLTISASTGTTNLTGVKDTYFENVKFINDYVLGDTVSTPVLASQTYELSLVTATGFITVSGSGLAATQTENFSSNVVTTINNLVVTLQGDVTFNNNFTATRSAESLIITASAESGLSASDITTFFTVGINPTSAPTQITITPTATQASTGINNTVAALSWSNTLFGTRTTNINFVDCEFNSVPLAIKCQQTTSYETEIKFTNTKFFNCDTGVYLEGVSDTQHNNWFFDNCRFEEIAKQVIISTAGVGTVIHNSDFKNCGNGISGAANPETAMVEFGTKYGNVVSNCRSDRQQSAGITLLTDTIGIPEIINGGSVNFLNDQYADVYLSDTFTPLTVFSSTNRYIVIDYVLTLSNNVRKGQLVLSIDDTMSDIAIADNYTYSPSLITDPGGPMMTNFEFNADLKDNDTDSGVDTVMLTYKNPLATGYPGTISYSISYGV